MERPTHEFPFTDRDLKRIIRLMSEHTGIAVRPGKKEMVYGRLAPRLRKLGLSKMRDYIDLIEDRSSDEFTCFVNAMTTNKTGFFREPHHFDYLKQQFLPELYTAHSKPALRIWSAGCSKGMEPLSIAIAVREAMERLGPMDVEILATDLDDSVLEVAKASVYPVEALEGLSPAQQERWFLRQTGDEQGLGRVHPALERLVTFEQQNLFGRWGSRDPWDVIFCRNTAIYFKRENQIALFRRLADRLRPGGLLALGHAETLGAASELFESCGLTLHRKRG